jgi:hypothetical protein
MMMIPSEHPESSGCLKISELNSRFVSNNIAHLAFPVSCESASVMTLILLARCRDAHPQSSKWIDAY